MKRVFVLLGFLASFNWALAATNFININQADATQIAEALPGIGKVKAEAIVSYRTANGDFREIEELANVPGIGAGILNKIRDLIRLKQPASENSSN
ncbi:MAG: ComEA family DNA-binding protein [Gammaproteobacteria bacterium]|nr:ComEA family DNA-binding protein [Gammaproteobacteria bacterium]